MLGTPYYFGTSRKITVAVGNLFNNLHVIRTDSLDAQVKDIKVPLAYSHKQHYLAKLRQADVANGASTSAILPRLSFMITGMQRASNRQKNAIHYAMKENTTNADVFSRMFSPVPYDINFEVVAYAKNMDDGLQMVEQIVPWFTPEFNLSIITVPELGISEDVPLVLDSVSPDDNAENGFAENRLITWTFNLTARAYFYKPIVDAKIIKTVIAEWKDKTLLTTIETQTLAVDPSTAFASDIYTITETIV